ncbi:MAG: phosphate ABC transporter permease subunit PstC [Clostridia bacterium]|nr:phosphate ABC transporter permease subunit PstC [Clostridia bacterium]
MHKINSGNSKKNKILFCASLILYILSILILFFMKINLNFDGLTYKVSYFDIILNSGLISSSKEFIFNFFTKFIISLSFLGSISSIFFILKKQKMQAAIFSSFFILSPLLFLCFNLIFSQVSVQNIEFILLHFLFSIFNTFLFFWFLDLEIAIKNFLKIIAIFCLLVLFMIVFYIIFAGLPAILKIGITKFLFGKEWAPAKNIYGILPFILCSLVVTAGAVLFSAPVGIFTAIFLACFCPKKLADFINLLIKVFSGIPSVVFGFFGMMIIVPAVKIIFKNYTTGDCLLTAIIILTIMILPTIISISEYSIKYFSDKFLEASLALGESKARSIFRVVLPAAKKGISSGIFLGLGRALGETMAIIMVSGNAVNMPGLLKSSRFLTTALALEFSYASGMHRQALFSIGLVLFLIIFIVNSLFIKFLRQEKIKK